MKKLALSYLALVFKAWGKGRCLRRRAPLMALVLCSGSLLAPPVQAGDYVWDNAGVAITNGGTTTVSWSAVNSWNPDGQTPNSLWANAILNQLNAAPFAASLTAGTVLNLDLGTSAITLNTFRQSSTAAPTNPNNITTNIVGGAGASLTLNQIIHSAGGTLQFGPSAPITTNVHANYNPTGSLRVVNTDDSQTQLQGLLTVAGDFVKDGSGTVRFGTTTASFTNAIGGNIIINNGTMEFSNGTSGNVLGGAGTKLILNAAGGTVNFRPDGSRDYIRDIDFNSNFFTFSADRSAGTSTGQTVQTGVLNVLEHDGYLVLNSGNAYNYQFDGINLGSKTLNFRNGLNGAGHALVGELRGDGTINMSGSGGNSANGLTFNTASPTFSGRVNLFEGGAHTISATGSLGSGTITLGEQSSTLPITYPNNPIGQSGSPNTMSNPWSGQLNYNANNPTTAGVGVVVNGASQVNMGVVPSATDVIRLNTYGIIQGDSAELGGFTVGTNLLLPASRAVISHENLAGADPAGLPAAPTHFFGASANLNGAITVGAATPWLGVSNDRFARIIGGGATALTVNGGDNDTATTEAVMAAFNAQELTLLGTAGDTWVSGNGNRFSLAIEGFGTTFGGLGGGGAPGGTVRLNQTAAASGLAANVDVINVNSGNFALGASLALGGVPLNINAGGGVDIAGVIGDALDATINVNAGGTLVLNDNTLMTGGAGNPININSGGILHITGQTTGAPAGILASTQPIAFVGSRHSVRIGVNNITGLDAAVPDAGAIWEIAATGTNTAASAFGTTIGATTLNTQTAGLSTDGGHFTTDAGASRFLDAPITIGNLGATFSATTNLTLALVQPVTSGTGAGAGTAPIQIGSLTPINYLTKTGNPTERANNADDILLPHNQSPQVIFTAGLRSGAVNHVTGSFYLDGPAANTAIAGDITMGANTRLYLGDGGNINTGNSFTGAAPRRGDLTPLLVGSGVTTTAGSKIVLGNYSRVELGLDSDDPAFIASAGANGGRAQVNQAFVITGDVNPDDRRSFWVNRVGTTNPTNVDFNNVTIRNNGHLAFQESTTDVRATVKLETDGRVSPFSAWDFKSILNVDNTGAPSTAAKTLTLGRPDTPIAAMALYGAVDQGITLNNEYARLELRDGSSLPATFVYNDNSSPRSIQSVQNTTTPGPSNGTDHTLSFFDGHDAVTPVTNGRFNINRGNALAGYVDEIAAGAPVTNPIGATINLNTTATTIFADRFNDNAVSGNVLFQNVNVNAANATLATRNGTDLEVGTLTVTQNSVIRVDGARADVNNDASGAVRVNTVAAAANDVHFQNGRTTITGGVTADVLTAGGTSLEFNPAGGAVTHSVTSVQVNTMLAAKAGTTDFGTANLVSNAVGTQVAGLREGMIAGGAINLGGANPGSTGVGANLYDNNNLGIRLDPRVAQNNFSTAGTVDTARGWGDNQTWVYTGQIFDADGIFSLAENIDDSVSIKIDGQVVLFSRNSGPASATGSNAEAANGYTPPGGGISPSGNAPAAPFDSWRTATSTGTTDGLTAAYWQANSVDAALDGILADTRLANANEYGGTLNFGAGAGGWHDIEIRIHNGTGGAASPTQLGWGNYFGLGLNDAGSTSLIGTDYTMPVDDGTMSLFRTTTVAKGNVDIDNDATVRAGNLMQIGLLTYGRNGAPGDSTLNLGGASTGNTDSINVAATAAGTARLNLGATTKLVAGQLNVADTEFFNLNATGSGELELTAGAALTANGSATVNVDAGTLRLSNTTGTATGNADLFINGGTLAGNGITTSPTTVLAGVVSPGNSTGFLTVGDAAGQGLLYSGGSYSAELDATSTAPNGLAYDVLNVTGTVDLTGNSALSLTLGYTPAVGDSFWILLNDGVDPIANTFLGLPEATIFTAGGSWFQITYLADGLTAGGSTLTGGNDVALTTVVPEPSISLLAAGSALLALRRRRRA